MPHLQRDNRIGTSRQDKMPKDQAGSLTVYAGGSYETNELLDRSIGGSINRSSN